jgi:hypothetical protein
MACGLVLAIGLILIELRLQLDQIVARPFITATRRHMLD